MDGRKNYTGPQIDAAALQNGEVTGMAPTESHTTAVDGVSDGMEVKGKSKAGGDDAEDVGKMYM